MDDKSLAAERAAFEAAMRERYPAPVLTYDASDNHYVDEALDMAWSGWQARALPPADAAEMKRLADALDLLPDDEYLVAMDGTDNGLALVKEAAALLRRMAGEK